MFSLSILKTRKRKEDNLNVRTSEVRWKLVYTWTLSLSQQLHIWTRGSHPAVHVPSSGASLTWALLLTLLWLSYLCVTLLSA